MRNRQTDAKKMGELGNRTMNYNPREYPIDQLLKTNAINASQKSQKNSLPSKKLSLDQIQKTHQLEAIEEEQDANRGCCFCIRP